jgi:hypothetical protein
LNFDTPQVCGLRQGCKRLSAPVRDGPSTSARYQIPPVYLVTLYFKEESRIEIVCIVNILDLFEAFPKLG